MDTEARAAAPIAEARPAWTGRRGPLVSLLLKDMLVFVRDPAQLSQSLLFFLLMVIYSLSLLRIPKDLLGTEKLRILVHFANLGAVCMILSAFTSRFLFPLLSLEGRAFWIVGLAPVRRSFLIQQKGIFGLGVSWTLGMITIIVSNAALAAPPALFLGAVYSVLLAGVCLTSLSTGLGAAYPTFEEDNPSRIAVGLGGTLNFFASALSVAVIIGLEAFPYILASRPALAFQAGLPDSPRWTWIWLSHTAAFAFTLALTVFCHRLGARSLERRDF